MKPIFIGCHFDSGIQMMPRFQRGVTGAADGPQAVLSQFDQAFDASTAVPRVMLPLEKYHLSPEIRNIDDPAVVEYQQALTEAAHDAITVQIHHWCTTGYLPVAIGGDHSLTYPLCRGVRLAYPNQ